MASMYGVVRTLFDHVPRHPLRSMLRRRPGATSRAGEYATLIEREIVPRLMLTHATSGPRVLHPSDALAFAPLALAGQAAELVAHAEALVDRGASIDAILVDGLAPAARSLGAMWEEDTADFVEVTMALWRLQQVVRELSARAGTVRPRAGRRALFSVVPGEQHSFGTVIVEDVFRRHGWTTAILTACDRTALLEAAAHSAYDMIGLSVSVDARAGEIAALVRALRSVSRNPAVAVMLGGRVFATAEPQVAADYGADAISGDARDALAVAMALVRERAALSA